MDHHQVLLLLTLLWGIAPGVLKAQPSSAQCVKLLDDLLLQYNASSIKEVANAQRIELEARVVALLELPECSNSPVQSPSGWNRLAPAIAVPSGILLLMLVGLLVACIIARRATGSGQVKEAPGQPADAVHASTGKPTHSEGSTNHHGFLWAVLELVGKKGRLRRRRLVSDAAPGVGVDTTLLLSDVQNSTSLWEMLPTYVMDECMRLHDKCFRSNLKKHMGYESATEGDAYILAFYSPADALRYAVEVQLSLLQVAWPAQLLINPDGRPVHCLVDADANSSTNQARRTSSRLNSVVTEGRTSGNTEHGVTWGILQTSPSSKLLTPMLSKKSLRKLKVGDLPWLSKSMTSHMDDEPMVDPEEEVEQVVQAAEQTAGGQSCLPALGTNTWSKQLGFAFPRVRESVAVKNGGHLIFNGLRVRMGIHTGIENKADVVTEPTSGRTTYAGATMDMARAVADAAPGGGVLLSQDAFVRVPHSLLAANSAVNKAINSTSNATGQAAGGARISMDQRTTAASECRLDGDDHKEPINALVVYAGDHTMIKLKAALPAVPLYMAVPSIIPGRLAWLSTIRNTTTTALGAAAAPVGMVTIAFLNVVGGAALLTDHPTEARQAITRLHAICIEELTKHKGFAVEVVDGLMLVAFQHPVHAVCWAINCNEQLQEEVWPDRLLEHEACKCGEAELAPWANPLSTLPAEMGARDTTTTATTMMMSTMGDITSPAFDTLRSTSIDLPRVPPRAVKSFSISRSLHSPPPPSPPGPPPLMAPPAKPTSMEIESQKSSMAADALSTSELAVSERSMSQSRKLFEQKSLLNMLGSNAGRQTSVGRDSNNASNLLNKLAGVVKRKDSQNLFSMFGDVHSNALFMDVADVAAEPDMFVADKPRAPRSMRSGLSRRQTSDSRPEKTSQPHHTAQGNRRPSLAQYLSTAMNRSTSVLSSMLPGGGHTSANEAMAVKSSRRAEALEATKLLAEAQKRQRSEARAAGQRLPGLFIKVGIDLGRVITSLHTQTGRVHYRGKVMNRAARVAARCQPGQVLLTGLAWKYATAAHDLMMIKTGVCGDELGAAEMKGVPGLVDLVHCFGNHAEANTRAEELKAKEMADADVSGTEGASDVQDTLTAQHSTATSYLTASPSLAHPVVGPARASLDMDTVLAPPLVPPPPRVSSPAVAASTGMPAVGLPGTSMLPDFRPYPGSPSIHASLKTAYDSITHSPARQGSDLDSSMVAFSCASSFQQFRSQGTDLSVASHSPPTAHQVPPQPPATAHAWPNSPWTIPALSSRPGSSQGATQTALEHTLDIGGPGIVRHNSLGEPPERPANMLAVLAVGSRSVGHLSTEGLFEPAPAPSSQTLKAVLSSHNSHARRPSRLGAPTSGSLFFADHMPQDARPVVPAAAPQAVPAVDPLATANASVASTVYAPGADASCSGTFLAQFLISQTANLYAGSLASAVPRVPQPARQLSGVSSLADDASQYLSPVRQQSRTIHESEFAVINSPSTPGRRDAGQVVEVTKRGVLRRDAFGTLRFSVTPRITECGPSPKGHQPGT